MTKVTIHVAKTNLSKLIAQVEAGEEVVICRGDKEVAKLVAVKGAPKGVGEDSEAWKEDVQPAQSQRKPGSLKGQVEITDGFYDPWSAKDFSPGIMDDFADWGEPGVWDGRSPRKPGRLKGQITLDESFFDPLSDEEMGLADDQDETLR
jgi:antitoxin (DNA-binding transcriptional repressor) of toxin-antitoxin stability system